MSDTPPNEPVEERIAIPLPRIGQVSIFSATRTSCFVLPFDSGDAAFLRQGNTLIIEKHGATIMLSDFFAPHANTDWPRLALPDGAELTAEAVAEAIDPANMDFTTESEVFLAENPDATEALFPSPMATTQCSTSAMGECSLPDSTHHSPAAFSAPASPIDDDAAALQQFLLTHSG